MWTIWTNVPITRRKSFYLIENPAGEVVFRNRHLWPCVEYLGACDIDVYQLRPSEAPKGSRIANLSIDRRQ